MNPAPPTPPSIQDIGLQRFLDRSRRKHNDLGYDNFVTLAEAPKDKRLGATALAKTFNVSTDTIYKWLRIYKKEKRKQT